jgi:hypothetical protein
MTYSGRIQNGAVVLDEPLQVPDGTEVRVEVVTGDAAPPTEEGPSFSERYAEIAGAAITLPETAAEDHDHLLYGRLKR